MSNRIYTIRNERTLKEYTVDQAGMDAIKRQEWGSKFTIIRETVVSDRKATNYIPEEIANAVRGASAALPKAAPKRAPKPENETNRPEGA